MIRLMPSWGSFDMTSSDTPCRGAAFIIHLAQLQTGKIPTRSVMLSICLAPSPRSLDLKYIGLCAAVTVLGHWAMGLSSLGPSRMAADRAI